MITLTVTASWTYNAAHDFHALKILGFEAGAHDDGYWSVVRADNGGLIAEGRTAARDLDSAKARAEAVVRRLHEMGGKS
jgi:hypothetical protein